MAKTKKTEAVVNNAVPAGYVPTLKKLYRDEIVPKLMKEFSYGTIMQVPKLVKITINQGIGDATGDKKLVETAQQELSAITGQKAVATTSRKDISNFKLRKGMPIGVKVTYPCFPPSYQGLQRYFREIGRKGKLHSRYQGADNFPGNRHRQDFENPWNGNHIRNYCKDGRRSSCPFA